jgi:DDE_Tnp_1-associated
VRQGVLAEQIKVWKRLLPPLFHKLSQIPDFRRPKSIKHKVTVLMMFGLLAFVFRLKSRREMNRELTGAAINYQLRKIFPELDSIPHADTLARFLETARIKEIESAHISMIKQLIKGKKFKKLLINGCLPITIDGCQKLFRHWLSQFITHHIEN